MESSLLSSPMLNKPSSEKAALLGSAVTCPGMIRCKGFAYELMH